MENYKNKNLIEKKCCIIIGSYINACSIYYSLMKIGFRDPIYIIEPNINSGKCLADVIAKKALVIKTKIVNVDEIVKIINERIPAYCKKYIFFTSEEFIDPIKNAVNTGELANIIAYTGSSFNNDLIFDRFKFYKFVEPYINTPLTIESTDDPFKLFGSTFVLRMKRTWNGNIKLPRLVIINGKEELEEVENDYMRKGYTKDMWCYQELLSISDEHNVSVCGWHDNYYKQYAVTRKIVQHPPKTGNGDVVEIMKEIPNGLIDATYNILRALNYAGPFEMEFVFDLKNNIYKVIELNPRYWMQHGLLETITNHSLIRRHLGDIGLSEIPPEQLPHKHWVNTNQALYRLVRGQLNILSYLKHGVNHPGIWSSINWMLYYFKYKKLLAGE